MRRKSILIVIILVLTGVMCFAGWKIWEIQSEYSSGESAYEKIEHYATFPSSEEPAGETAEPSAYAWPVVDFDVLQATNPDVVGWIYLKDSKINYPIVQGSDNSYYLNHLFTKERNSAGCIFLDSRNSKDFSDRNNVVYGHHMKNGSMFTGLEAYKTQAFYDAHPIVQILTQDQNYELELFAGYVTEVEDDAWQLGFTEPEFEKWLGKAVNRSAFASTVTPTADDRVVTLSTCSYEFDNARFVVHGILKQQ